MFLLPQERKGARLSAPHADRNSTDSSGAGRPVLREFLGSEAVVGKLVSSPSDYPRAYICDECIFVCWSILQDDKLGQPGPDSQPPDQYLDILRSRVDQRFAEFDKRLDDIEQRRSDQRAGELQEILRAALGRVEDLLVAGLKQLKEQG